uniref:Thioredoxin domain-containing protein n=1 Tax=Arcella intermedia TaxID=1963864 RepID=A0A6B2L4W5_9EUKA
MSPEHDVVVEFFSPTCIYCIRFEPIWKEVAGHFKDEDSILITRIDASRPDGNIPDIEITGVPTVIIFPAAAKDRPLVYTDQRSASLIVEWILEKAHLPVEVHISYKSEPIPSSPKNGNVIEVVGLNWKSVVLNPDKDVFVNFYAPWCPYSNMLQPTWSQLEQRLRSVPTITIAQFDGTANEVPGLHLHAFPTMTLYRAGNNEQRPYRGNQRTVEAFIEFLQKETLREWTDPETGVTNSHVEHVEKDHAVDVPELNDDNYLQTIQDKDKNVVVLFYAPWCEHSQELFSTWEEIYMDYRSIRTVSVVQIDATKYKSPQISIYPTIKIFPASNLPKDTEGITFKGKETTARNIKEFIQTNAVRPSVEIKIQEAHLEASKKGLPPPTENELEAQHGIDFPEIDYSSGQSLLYRQKTDL